MTDAEQDKKDALRYRYLREAGACIQPWTDWYFRNGELDRRIDRLMGDHSAGPWTDIALIAQEMRKGESPSLINCAGFIQCSECGQAAFYLSEPPKAGETVNSEKALFSDGTQPKAGDPVACQSCGKEPDIEVDFWRSFPAATPSPPDHAAS